MAEYSPSSHFDLTRRQAVAALAAGRGANSIRADKKRWVDFMMWFELGLEEPGPKRAGRSALIISLA